MKIADGNASILYLTQLIIHLLPSRKTPKMKKMFLIVKLFNIYLNIKTDYNLNNFYSLNIINKLEVCHNVNIVRRGYL